MKTFKEFCEEHGAGFEGTPKLTKKYKKDTPGENNIKNNKRQSRINKWKN